MRCKKARALNVPIPRTIRGLMLCFTLANAPAGATDDLSQPIRVSPDGHFLVHPDGEPFFWLGDTAWELFQRLDRQETEQYLLDRASKGFNVIQAVATSLFGINIPNRYGEVSFIEADPTRPNEKYFAHIDWVVERAARHGVRIAMLPAWGRSAVSGRPSPAITEINAEEYGQWLARRYRGKGVIWVLGGDINPLWYRDAKGDRTIMDYRPVYDAMAKGIKAGGGGDPFITYHPTQSSPSGAAVPRMSLYFGDRDWYDMSMLQSGHLRIVSGDEGGGGLAKDFAIPGTRFFWNPAFNYLPVLEEYKAVSPRPVIDAEPSYEASPVITDLSKTETEFWQPRHVRNSLYQALFAGAAGHTYGHVSIWDFHDPRHSDRPQIPHVSRYGRVSWQQALDAPGGNQVQHAKALMLSRPYFSRIPDQTLIVGGPERGEQHIGATRDRGGKYALIYIPKGRPVIVDLSKIAGSRAIAWWFDPRIGTARKLDKSWPTAATASFSPPTQGEDQDWVLVLDSADSSFGPPGATP